MNNDIPVKDEQTEIAQRESNQLVLQADTFTIETEAQLNEASELLRKIKTAYKTVEERRTFVVKPLNDQIRNINGWFKSITEPLVQAEDILKRKVLTFRQEQERIRLAEQKRLEEEAAKKQAEINKLAEQKGVEAPVLNVPKLAELDKTVNTSTIKKVWTFEVTDLNLIPREYLVVDETKIRNAVREGVRNIPGVKIFEKDQLAVRI